MRFGFNSAIAFGMTMAAGLVPAASAQTVASQLVAMDSGLDVLTEADRRRLSRMDESRTKGIAKARTGEAKVFALAQAILSAPSLPVDLRKLQGNWKCRTFSLGGTLGRKFAAHKTAFFRCSIGAKGKTFSLRKLSGSMAWSATLKPLDGNRVLYYGSAIARGDKIPVYPDKVRFSSHQVGILEQIGAKRLRIEMPEPVHNGQSFHDLIELVR